jgi:hypothetical protein
MTEQIVLSPSSSEAETVCTTCKHFIELEEGFFCSFFAAFLSTESLCIPCDFIEKTEDSF